MKYFVIFIIVVTTVSLLLLRSTTIRDDAIPPRIRVVDAQSGDLFKWWIRCARLRNWDNISSQFSSVVGFEVTQKEDGFGVGPVMVATSDGSSSAICGFYERFVGVGNSNGGFSKWHSSIATEVFDDSWHADCKSVVDFASMVDADVLPVPSEAQIEQVGRTWLLSVVWQYSNGGALAVFFLDDRAPRFVR